MKEITINFIRHGKTFYNEIGKIQGSSNITLSEEGIQQAIDFNIDPNTIYDVAFHSSLSRSKETLRIICDNLKCKPFFSLNNLITERSYGIFEGLTNEQILEKYPKLYNAWKSNENTPIENSETIDNVVLRIKRFISLIINFNYKNIIAVTHSGVLYALYKYISKTPLGERPQNITFDNCSSNILKIFYDQNIIHLKFFIENQTNIECSCPTKEIISNTRTT